MEQPDLGLFSYSAPDGTIVLGVASDVLRLYGFRTAKEARHGGCV